MAKLGEYGDRLEEMTEQEVATVGVVHLLEQGAKSVEKDRVSEFCAYSGEEGLCCGAGPFIPDYYSGMEGSNWTMLVSKGEVPSTHKHIINKLQLIHDHCGVYKWPHKLADLCDSTNTPYPEILVKALESSDVS